jgi:hypothetical protein
MRVLTFQPQFHPLIRSGQKTSTIRDKARCKPGDELSLRRWIGKPYKPPGQELLIPNQVCTAVTQVRMHIHPGNEAFVMSVVQEYDGSWPGGSWVTIADSHQVTERACHIARREGFASFHVMKDWFITNKKIRPFKPYEGSR